ncbi:MAG TPA: helix-turn-helix domain-containing protein [Nitrososphaeraceae archaeon]
MNESKQKQIKAHVRIHLLLGKSITPDECKRLYRGSRLAVVINRLRNEGLNIITNIIREPNGDQYAEYSLIKPIKKQKLCVTK